MRHPKDREDFSRFVIHLTRDFEDTNPLENLISILRSRRIEARSAHCLFSHKISGIGFSNVLKKKFNTVCLTEVPLNQLRYIVGAYPGKSIELAPYGLVFLKSNLLEKGANPAIYVNSQETGLREFLLNQFMDNFGSRKTYRSLRKFYGDHADAIIRYYSFVNLLSPQIDFSWEREWRHQGHLKFEYDEIVAIVVPDPDKFSEKLRSYFGRVLAKEIDMIAVISPDWNYEQLLEAMSICVWNAKF